jgi:hypothetical protein
VPTQDIHVCGFTITEKLQLCDFGTLAGMAGKTAAGWRGRSARRYDPPMTTGGNADPLRL